MITVIDTETVGFEPPMGGQGVVEVAGVRIPDNAGDVWSWFSSLVKPSVPIEIQAMAAHHITEEMVVNAKSLETALQPLATDISGVYAAHNAEFDRKFLPEWLRSRRWICTWRCALHLWPDAPTHSNQGLRYWLNLDLGDLPPEAGSSPHRALYDAWVTAKLLEEMLVTCGTDTLLKLSTTPVLLRRIAFGKHRDTQWSDVDSGYLRWVMKQDFDEDVRHTARHWLSERGH